MDMFAERSILLGNIDNIIRTSRNEEKKASSAQIGLFDGGAGADFDDSFQLE